MIPLAYRPELDMLILGLGVIALLITGWLLFWLLPWCLMRWRICRSEPIVRQRLIARGVLPLGVPPKQPKRKP